MSQTIFFDQLLFEKNIPQLPRLKQVVFCIEYTNLSQVDDTGDDPWRKFYYQRFMGLQVPTISVFDPRQYSLALVQNFVRFKKILYRYLQEGTIVDCDASGWGTNYKKQNRTDPNKVAQERALVQEDGLMDFTLNKNRIQAIINRCKEEKLQILIVSMPQTQVYGRYLNPKKLLAIQKACFEFQQKNLGTAYYLNLFNDARFSDDDFYDADHLNDVGATKCSRIVNENLSAMEKTLQ
ncbi:hypothetical protein G4D82_02670 [Flavobacterium sp. CYK-4]|uniref:hypothetical protein n=1 Tax=Flavobacterium lotistagni TaxID=2709660 RepID=UPI00140E357D|nr:hypothetical protein [Flavobacterium lotistagni]NHM06113.1 hypothetical protein [Flavobacterium lotistagni]